MKCVFVISPKLLPLDKKILKLMFYILFCANLFVILQYELYSIMAAARCRV